MIIHRQTNACVTFTVHDILDSEASCLVEGGQEVGHHTGGLERGKFYKRHLPRTPDRNRFQRQRTVPAVETNDAYQIE